MNLLYDYTRNGLGNYRLRNTYIPLFEVFRNSLAYEEFTKKDSVIRSYDWFRYLDIVLATKYTDTERFDDAIKSYDSYIHSENKPENHKELIEARVLMFQAILKNTMGNIGVALATAERAISIVKDQAQNIDDPDKATRWDINFMADICRSYLGFLTSRGSLLEADSERKSLGLLLGVNLSLRWNGQYYSE